ncbi:MAG TPA: type III-A CRISPR-associated protein Csm2 [Chloroflexia bacterium]|nr:type III-A CRISPR-associated protein Csm2 [Chloroflexia bacterium]
MTTHAPGGPASPPASVIATAAAAAPAIVRGMGPEDSQLLVEQAKLVGEYLKNQGLTTSQIRNVFGTVRSIESTWRLAGRAGGDAAEATRTRTRALHDLNLLKPRMAYAASRSPVVRHLADVLTPAIDAVLADPAPPAGADRADPALQRFGNFLDFFEAILAYHRAAGGR